MTTVRNATTRLLMTLALACAALTVAAPSADATPISHLVDCDDSFWAITCGMDPVEPSDEVLGITITAIDGPVTCSPTADGYVLCTS